MNLRGAAWKVFSLHKNELHFALPLFLLYFLSGSFYAVGQIFTETVFLKSYGAAGFSYFFIYNGAALITVGIIYNSFFTRISFRKGYVILIIAFTALISASPLLMNIAPDRAPFLLYMANYIFTFFLDIHFFNYAFQHLTLGSSKRILPFVMAGGKLGGITVSLTIFTALSGSVLAAGTFVWAANCAALLIPIVLLFLKGGPVISQGGSSRGINPGSGISNEIKKVRNIFSTEIFAITAAAVFFMSVVNQVSEFYYADAFNSRFETKEELASFLSLYTFASDFITLALQLAFTSRIIRTLGVRRANYIYPASFLAFLGASIISPGLVGGILLRFFRKNLSLAVRTPIHNIIMASTPRDRMAEAKALIGGVISPLGMTAGGFLILLLTGGLSYKAGLAVTALAGIIYLALVYAQNTAYVKSIKNRLILDFRKNKGADETKVDYTRFLKSDVIGEFSVSSIEDIFRENPSLEGIELMFERYSGITPETKICILRLLKTAFHPLKEKIIRLAFDDDDVAVRAEAIDLAYDLNSYVRNSIIYGTKFPGRETPERIAVSLVENAVRGEDSPYADEYAGLFEKWAVTEKRDPAGLLPLIRILFRKHDHSALVRAAISTLDPVYLYELVRHSDRLSRGQTARLIAAFSHLGPEPLTALTENAPAFTSSDRVILLDMVANISSREMERLFSFGNIEKANALVTKRLSRNRSYHQKSNYLNYFMAAGYKPERAIKDFIDGEVQTCTRLHDLADMLAGESETVFKNRRVAVLFSFLEAAVRESIELRKRLILKGAAIITGIHIDELYDSNLLVQDRDLNSYIFEFIDAHYMNSRMIFELFEGRRDKKIHVSGGRRRAIESALKELPFIPNISTIMNGITLETGIEGENRFALKISKGGYEMLDLMEKILHLKKTSIFSDLKPGELIHIAKITEEIELPAGSYLIKQGETGDELFILLDGEVEVFTDKKEIEILGNGSCVGELSIIDAEPRSTNVVTKRHSKFLSIKRKEFLLTLKENPVISINIMKIITGRLRRMIGR